MKVGILTFHSSYNFGANLQTLATLAAFKKAGADAEVINYRNERKLDAYRAFVDPRQSEEHDRFASEYLTLSPPLNTPGEVRDYCCSALDGVVVGSDAVFRLAARYQPRKILNRLLRQDSRYNAFSQSDTLDPYWLEWSKRPDGRPVKAALAASSRGTAFYLLSAGLYRRLWTCLRDFDYLSVRDQWTRLMVMSLSLGTVTPHLCPDPVFCLNRTFTVPEPERVVADLGNTILVGGTLGGGLVEALRAEATKRGFEMAFLANPEDGAIPRLDDKGLGLPLSPLRWYHALASARGYVGARFHALVSCMANDTPVVTVDVSKPLVSRHNRRNPNYDLCRAANTPTRYYLKSAIERTAPATLFEILLDQQINRHSKEYAAWAADEVLRNIQHILGKVATRM